jgi:hypothetical protein
MSRKPFTVLAVVGALALPGTAGAEISTFSEATLGKLRVLSSVVLTRGAVDMMGGWLNTARPCTAERRLRVVARIYRSRGNSTSVTGDNVTRRMMNCAEGGPNLGFHFDAETTEPRFACPDGSWKPGRYDFITRTKHLASGLVSVASLGWTKREPCS